jgi:outer membrane protein OmpA-like peptidoglycan-associated protein
MKLLLLALAISGLCHGQATDTMNVLFDFDRFELKEEARKMLDDRLGSGFSFTAELRGHCDSRGSDAYNIRLSQNRVQAVRRYLLSKGVPPDKIGETRGFGESLPVADNSSDEGRALNRRVEVIFHRVSDEKTGGLKEKLADTTLTVGSNIALRNINFEGGRSLILDSSFPALEELLNAMKDFPALVIQIEGHICCQDGPQDGLDMGTGIYNLSEARARAIRNYLVENGIAANRLSYRGFGHSRPLHPYPEETEEQRIANRRVEIRIVNK